MDLAIDNDALDHLMEQLPDHEIFPISGVSRQGVDPLLETLWTLLKEMRLDAPMETPRMAPPLREMPAGEPSHD